jgi:predicted HTH domain antitoxin
MRYAANIHGAIYPLDLAPIGCCQSTGSSLNEAADSLKQLALIELFRWGEVSSGYAAEVLGMSRWDFIKLLGARGVPYVDMTPEELDEEVELALSLASPPGGPSSPTPAP